MVTLWAVVGYTDGELLGWLLCGQWLVTLMGSYLVGYSDKEWLVTLTGSYLVGNSVGSGWSL